MVLDALNSFDGPLRKLNSGEYLKSEQLNSHQKRVTIFSKDNKPLENLYYSDVDGDGKNDRTERYVMSNDNRAVLYENYWDNDKK
ncbi:MAG: hypothetical protein II085_01110, partial [Alphaproteobacteria bacterium]|nr:hypothetical protein [Alphaproteobacteria bacterium]